MTRRIILSRMNIFQKTALITIAVTFLLIFIGGLVRATGAGLGCPDWPKCFGLWIPPLSAADLPSGYNPDEFNVFKTWMEYINRLTGVIVGLLITLTFILSIPFVRTVRSVFFGALAALILVLFQGWLGGQVVLGGLQSWMISIHMVTAIVILNVLIWTVYQSFREKVQLSLPPRLRRNLLFVLILIIGVVIVQVVFGTQVREGLETVKSAYPALERSEWLDRVGLIDRIHRSFTWLVLVLVLVFHILVYRNAAGTSLQTMANLTTGAVLLQIAVGTGLVYLGIPPVFQVLHLWIAAFTVSVPFLALLLVAGSEPVLRANTGKSIE